MLTYFTRWSSQKRDDSEELFNAIKERSIDDLQRLIDDPDCDLNVPLKIPDIIGFRKATALHMAIESAPTDSIETQSMVRMLLESGRCNVNATDSDGRTPLHNAVIHFSVVAARLLIDNPKCKLNVCDKLDDLSPLQLATQTLDPAIFNMLLAHSGDRCNINFITRDSKETLLHFMCSWVVLRQRAFSSTECDPFISALLMNEDFNLWEAKNNVGDTALIHLLKGHYINAIEPTVCALIKSQKFDLEAVDCNGDTVLHLAIESGLCSVVEDLIASGKCNLLARNKKGDTTFHEACYPHKRISWQSCRIVRLLLSLDIYDINAQNNSGCTPLMCSVCALSLLEPDVEKIKLLVDNGADVDMTDEQDRNVLYHLFVLNMIYRKELDKILNIFFEAGIDTHSYSTWYACNRWSRHEEMLKLFQAEGMPSQPPNQQEEKEMPNITSANQPSISNAYKLCSTM